MTVVNKFILTGPPGSGKSAVIEKLKEEEICCVDEYAREIISEQRSINGKGLYDHDPELFKELMLSRAIHDYKKSVDTEITIFDRGIPDILAYTDCFNLIAGAELKAAEAYKYNPLVFFAPSWKEIYTNDQERQISFEEAKLFGDNLIKIYAKLGYELLALPNGTIEERVSLIKNHLYHKEVS